MINNIINAPSNIPPSISSISDQDLEFPDFMTQGGAFPGLNGEDPTYPPTAATTGVPFDLDMMYSGTRNDYAGDYSATTTPTRTTNTPAEMLGDFSNTNNDYYNVDNAGSGTGTYNYSNGEDLAIFLQGLGATTGVQLNNNNNNNNNNDSGFNTNTASGTTTMTRNDYSIPVNEEEESEGDDADKESNGESIESSPTVPTTDNTFH
ncbi:unnamed protein product [Ambrosiozyma monospora]|uniref:Unnamed protein product n=1 Tax=Ambrosiozyma monospora TaxID=43982 RepID=A0ACB5TJL6_AMBMO|nr:unnamed protein product [Ambrosiozyma monospora]